MTTRGKNFTEREKFKLLELVQKFKHIIENKCTNAVSTLQKNEAWESITTEFNSAAEVPRTQKQLSTAYLNLKRSTRQNVANENVKKYLEQKHSKIVADCEAGPSQFITLVDESNIQRSSNEQTAELHILDQNRNYEVDQSSSQQIAEIKSLIKQLKKDEIADKKGIQATGGGTYAPVLSSIGAQVLAVMGDQVQPLSNNCDSASSYYNNDGDVKTICYDVPLQPATSTLQSQTNKVKKKRILQTKKLTQQSNRNNILKQKYYRKKIESAVIEKRIKLIEYKLALQKEKLLDLEIKIKKQEYENILSK